ncbi:UDP-glucuronic acid decarboxylase 1 [Anas platyrhynchos]|uniref:UDP-glucuronic acid decarboxylase 1 n=1 Tax=Anas platyrhynchos TaxID=8839 RepID=R0KZ06_ANAPL|nr:UDP-glucuronic acid decarboxylase 1 [Anas platyrhynchos]
MNPFSHRLHLHHLEAIVKRQLKNMRSLQENGDQKVESKIEEAVAPLREKIRDLEKSFTQKYPPVKFLSEKDRKRILEIMDSEQKKLTLQKQHKEFETAHVSESIKWRKSEIISVWQV